MNKKEEYQNKILWGTGSVIFGWFSILLVVGMTFYHDILITEYITHIVILMLIVLYSRKDVERTIDKSKLEGVDIFDEDD